MEISFAELSAWLGGFVWPWLRVSGMLIVAPLFANTQVPARVSVLLGLALSVAILPAVGPVPEVDFLSLTAMIIAVQQILIGFSIGLMLALAFAAAIIAGESIAYSMGLGFATMVDPQGGHTMPIISQFFQIVATLLFLAMGGHLMLIELLAESFVGMPVGTTGIGADEMWLVIGWASEMFAGAVLIALPSVVVLLLTNLALGVMTRTAPQMNIFSVGLPVTMLLGFVVILTLTMPALGPRMAQLWSEVFAAVRLLLGTG
ncbi:flagellar biosynthetic protein FliR [Alkalilimnicola ehrlichii]|uniref:Flagellar biosynthetic protein FliR n=1 Tax=Alkalilimnicola ehrlichii TaxID=351052 RepID=A0A3E0WUN8_9GAMM|nr:flagellar biosynthetic protein FliR [Alkalilimnicola ehrlichii]RFA28533.1 flagellar biosynthetic protein FliR [Alkalilimnicola ehrlichii]RFA35695.1 flagellar biosynthetic protein FliR [Alkalilimnicola ehrlichii]